MNVFGFNAGLLGDLVMCSVVAREFKSRHPQDKLTFCMGNKFSHAKFLFEGLPFIDDFHIWDSYDNFPSEKDKEFIELNNKDGIVVNPFPQHSIPDWYNQWHYVQEHCFMNGVVPSYNLHCQLGYESPVNTWKDLVTLSMFASGNQPEKSLSKENLEKLVKMLKAKGFMVAQLGGHFDKYAIPGALTPPVDLRGAVDMLNQSRFHITIDTSFSWIASAYNHPVIGLYGRNYPDMKPDRIISHNPINDNALYINNETVNEISIDRIEEAVNLIK